MGSLLSYFFGPWGTRLDDVIRSSESAAQTTCNHSSDREHKRKFTESKDNDQEEEEEEEQRRDKLTEYFPEPGIYRLTRQVCEEKNKTQSTPLPRFSFQIACRAIIETTAWQKCSDSTEIYRTSSKSYRVYLPKEAAVWRLQGGRMLTNMIVINERVEPNVENTRNGVPESNLKSGQVMYAEVNLMTLFKNGGLPKGCFDIFD